MEYSDESSKLKFGVERILSSDFCNKTLPIPKVTIKLFGNYSGQECPCIGGCNKCMTFCNFTSESLCASNYTSVIEKYQSICRPAPLRPIPRGNYSLFLLIIISYFAKKINKKYQWS